MKAYSWTGFALTIGLVLVTWQMLVAWSAKYAGPEWWKRPGFTQDREWTTAVCTTFLGIIFVHFLITFCLMIAAIISRKRRPENYSLSLASLWITQGIAIFLIIWAAFAINPI